MAPKTAQYAAGVTCLGFVCLAVACASVGVPIWGYYDANGGYYEVDKGYFSPFKVCKQLGYNREKCGSDVSRFSPSCEYAFLLCFYIDWMFGRWLADDRLYR